MGKIHTLRNLIGIIKDKASLSKAAILSNPTAATLHQAVLRATTHAPPSAYDDIHFNSLLVLGDSSRATASAIITALMDRLHRTRNTIVALKCLLIIHHIIKRGPFILQDQLSIFPANGGYNYLKLSAFRDSTTAATWGLSAWVRWYARYLETLLSTSRVLGYFLCSSSNSMVKEIQEQRIPSFLNLDLIKDMDSLVQLLEEICKVPDSLLPEDDRLIEEIVKLLYNDYLSTVNEILLRIEELKHRLNFLNFGDSVELICSLKRSQDCENRLSELYPMKKASIDTMRASIQEAKDAIGMLKIHKEGGRSVGREKMSESARFEERVLSVGDSIHFQSGRFAMNDLSTCHD
ncbi:putative clathrin assembly protein At4g40080 [Primulina tabacum]|uniref:putative clathrin assembly protein At4g40080 n=1 Tax=Primulina tabacum TaxID=48773 RepID=UPI003F5A62A5